MAELSLSSARLQFRDDLEAIEHYIEQGWTDGLPVIPPTPERVAEFLAAANLAPDQIVAENRTRRRIVPAEKVAINAVMAGCKPEYMPVVVAVLEALCDDAYNLHGPTASLAGAAPLIIVSGPVARQLGFNSGYNLFGQGWRANATVGRAARLMLLNLFGAVPGVLDKSTFGHPGKYTYCIAESDDLKGWVPFHVEQGFAPEDSTVTVFAAMAPIQIAWGNDGVPEHILAAIGRGLARAAGAAWGTWAVVISPEHHAHLVREGWSKAQVRQYIWEQAYRTVADLKRAGQIAGPITPNDEETEARPLQRPEDILLVLGGGGAGQFSIIVPHWAGRGLSRPATKRIRLP